MWDEGGVFIVVVVVVFFFGDKVRSFSISVSILESVPWPKSNMCKHELSMCEHVPSCSFLSYNHKMFFSKVYDDLLLQFVFHASSVLVKSAGSRWLIPWFPQNRGWNLSEHHELPPFAQTTVVAIDLSLPVKSDWCFFSGISRASSDSWGGVILIDCGDLDV